MRNLITIVESMSGNIHIDNHGTITPYAGQALGGNSYDGFFYMPEYSYVGHANMYSQEAIEALLETLSGGDFPIEIKNSTMKSTKPKTIWTKNELEKQLAGTTYYYHGTYRSLLPRIKAEGLVPSRKSEWANYDDDPDLGRYSLGKIFFAPTADQAFGYAEEKSNIGHGNEEVVILRVPSSALPKREYDHSGRGGDMFVTSPVAPNMIEVRDGSSWRKL